MRYYWRNCCTYILVAVLKLPAAAASVTLAWNPDAEPSVSGYNVYYGSASGVYSQKTSAGRATQVTIAGLTPGSAYYFAASAYNVDGLESSLSAEVAYRIPQPASTTSQVPTLNPIDNVVVGMNAGPQIVILTGITSGAANRTLVVRAVSSNPGLIPNPTVTYTSAATTGTLSFRPVTGQSGVAVITVTASAGGAGNNTATRTFSVTVTPVSAPGAPAAGSRPIITCSLTNQAALVGQTRNFVVKAAGKGTLKYRWKFNGTNLPATEPMLMLSNLSTNQSGVYSVTVTDLNGSTNSSAVLTVYATASGTLASAGLANGRCILTVPTVSGCRYIVQASTDLVHWTPVRTNIAPFTCEDTAAGQFNRRFYRAVYAP